MRLQTILGNTDLNFIEKLLVQSVLWSKEITRSHTQIEWKTNRKTIEPQMGVTKKIYQDKMKPFTQKLPVTSLPYE